jgi:transketolase
MEIQMSQKDIRDLSINTIRFLAVDGVQKANSGHPGMPMGCAPIAYLLYAKIMNHNPLDPKWVNRDRFVLSAGHGSMLLYSALHLSGYEVSLDDLQNFRQWGSITPGHPEYGLTPGVETTTGPLGQGFANAVGMAAAQEFLAAKFNKDDIKILDNFIYVIAGDGDLMEGVSHESASFAGHNKLGKLIVFYDNNSITIDGSTELSMSDDAQKRFEAYGWFVQSVDDVNDLDKLEAAVKKAQASDKPSLIITSTHIGFGSPNKQDTSSAHGAPLGDEEVAATKKNLGWPEDKFFYIPDEVKKHFGEVKTNGKQKQDEWNKLFEEYSNKYPEDASLFKKVMSGEFGDEWKALLPKFENYGETQATRKSSEKVINSICEKLPTLFGGSADLAASTNTKIKTDKDFSATNRISRNINFGIREFGMAAMLNGMALYGGVIPYGATFLVFSDYLRPAIRLAALSKIKSIYVFTHDSIGLGEDGPTHQPIEHLASLRAIPGLVVIRPADANETTYAWKAALEHTGSPVAIVLTRQGLKIIDRNKYASAEGLDKGAYIIKDSEGKPDVILIATGSEVSMTLEASELLESDGIKTRVVSMPSWELFEMQDDNYKEKVLPEDVKARLSVEAGVKQGWEKYVGDAGDSISIEKYGASAPLNVIFEKYGFSAENIVAKAKELIKK